MTRRLSKEEEKEEGTRKGDLLVGWEEKSRGFWAPSFSLRLVPGAAVSHGQIPRPQRDRHTSRHTFLRHPSVSPFVYIYLPQNNNWYSCIIFQRRARCLCRLAVRLGCRRASHPFFFVTSSRPCIWLSPTEEAEAAFLFIAAPCSSLLITEPLALLTGFVCNVAGILNYSRLE